MKNPVEGMQRPEWLDAWLDYPHGALNENSARKLAWYAQAQAAEIERLTQKVDFYIESAKIERAESKAAEAANASLVERVNKARWKLFEAIDAWPTSIEAHRKVILDAHELLAPTEEKNDSE